MFLNGSSSGSQSFLEKLEGSLVDLLNSHLKKLEDSLFEWRELSDSVHESSDISDSVAGSDLSVHWSLFVFEFGYDESLVESEGITKDAVC